MFSKTFGYALRAVTFIHLHGQEGRKVGVQELAQALEIPQHFLGKVMQDLVRHGIVDSIKGPSGGFYANSRTGDYPLVDILLITDGNLIFNHCALNMRQCSTEHPCPLHRDFAICRDGMLREMAVKTVKTLSQGVAKGETFLAS
ncbi:MAG TPA: Rrf2 family transcriptional regulator [Saprospiraceae bacterium]|nr:Rrf2 family transcriptional regulator [Saprospiraceae bacterium]HND87624.1 Rrf2 family transcriptional regulator [Saprospiraceae bacterium]